WRCGSAGPPRLPVPHSDSLVFPFPPGSIRTMIGRIWHGWAAQEDADAYQDMLNSDVLPGIHKIPGYHGAYVMRRDVGDEVEFTTLTIFEDLAAVKQFAGEDYT